jgi:cell division transport system permease protein
MKNIFYNAGYFVRETRTLIGSNAWSKLFSLLSTGLIFFLLAMVISGWWASNQVIAAIQGEAEISVYYKEGMNNADVAKLIVDIGSIKGVNSVRLVDKDEAYKRMADILGKEARVLEYFNDNPFSPFIEVKINLGEMTGILTKIQSITGIEHVRDNREVLDKLQDIAKVLKVLGYLIITAVAVSTLVIIAHIIRLGVYNNREQINTMRLLGAPESFIAIPFLMEGLVLTVGGGILASALSAFMVNYIYAKTAAPLPFIPLPQPGVMIPGLIGLIMLLSIVLGILGGLFGLSSAKQN